MRVRDQYKTEYNCWANLRRRCDNPNNPRYSSYGGRGITYAEEWKQFKNFLADMGECPEGMSLDRIDNNGSYCKENCRWANRRQQQRNRRSNRLITYKGKTQSVVEWAEELGVKVSALRNRLHEGWSDEEALEKPVPPAERLLTYNGKTQNQTEWSLALGGNPTLVSTRLKKGWTLEKALSTPARAKKVS